MLELFFVLILGLCFGSFVNALVWRLRKKRNFVSERSECTYCHHVLAWYDLVPVVSWLSLRGRCRYCHKQIEDSPLTEIGLAVAFGVSYAFWPFAATTTGYVLLGLWLLMLVLLAALFVYDLRWQLLPDKLTFPLIGLGVIWAVIYYGWYDQVSLETLLVELSGGLVSVAGIYGLLFMASKGAWVGLGDVKLGIFMGLVLGWQRGFLSLILANVLAIIIILPGLLSGKISRRSRIPFGPFLILATFISLLFGSEIISWYIQFTIGAY